MILSLKSVITLAFILLFSIAVIAQDKPEEFRKAIEMADGYFTKGDYINAKASYQMALKLSPDDAYTKDRLQQSLSLIKVQMQQNAFYTEKIVVADDLYRQGDLTGALTVYKSALEFLPGDAYANDRVKEIEKTFADQRQKEADYKSGIAAGDKLLANGNLQGSLEEYRKASGLKPEESYPKQKIAEVEKLMADQKMVAGSYEKAMADADLAIQRKKYDEAILLLESASKIKPDESLPKQKLAEVKVMKEDYSSYSSIIEQADNHYIEKDFEKAKAGYQKALEIKPEDEYPKSMLDKIDIALMDIAKANKSSYEIAIAQADKLYNQADYEQAMVEYKNALRFKPDETYARQRISDINGTLSMMKSQEEAYAQSISRADNLYEEQRFGEAMEEYNRAIGFRPMEQYPKVKIEEIEVILSEIQNQRQIYSNLIAGADKLYYADDYEQARDQYRKASDLFPKEQYPLDQIRMINEILGQRDTYTKALTEADKLLYDKKYEDALAEYKRAASLNENEAYPQGRIYEIETLIAEEERMKGLQREYDSVLYLADDQFLAGDYITAMETYKSAQAILPTEGYPKKKMDEIRRIETETAAREAFDEQYSGYLVEADKLLAAGDHSKALTLYEAALNMKPGEDYPKTRVAEIQGVKADIAAKEALEKQYSDVISNADKLFAAKEYQEALAAYQTAAGLKPAETYPGEKAKEINNVLGEIAVKEALDKQYTDAISKADGLLASNDYQNALAAFQAASNLKPGESYPGQKIKEISAKLEEIAARESLDKQYADAIAKADNLLAAKDYQAAIAAYNAAAKLMPDDNYPAGKIAEINSVLEQVAAREALDKKYTETITSADRLMAVKDYQDAILAYQAALTIKPGEAYPTGKIAEINGILGEIVAKEAMDKRYAETISNADKLFAAKEYQEALAAYQTAAGLKPAEAYPGEKIKEINNALGEIAAKEALDKQYADAISKADGLLAADDYQNALASFQAASKLKPGEAYPGQKIKEISAKLEEIAAREALDKQYADAILKADNMLAAKDYQAAIAAYNAAAKLMPDDNYPAGKIAEINSILEQVAAREALDKKYAETIVSADKLLAIKDYQDAIIAYEAALEIKPGEAYPGGKIAEINGILGDIAAKEALDKQYAETMASAEAARQAGDYEKALAAYQAAAALKPAEKYPADKINEINGILNAIATKIAEEEKKYNDAIAFGDKHLANKDYENARKEYLLASSIKIGEAYPAQKLSEIDAIEAEIRKEKELETKYNKAIAAADAFMTKEQYEEARASYKDALAVKPDQDYPQQQLIEISRKLELQVQEREQSYQAAVAKADNYLEQQDYEMAKIQYERAMELKPDQVYPLDKLKLVNEQIMKKRQIVQAEYDKAIADADKYYASKLYDNAIESYRASSLLKPDEEYPKEMVRRILKMLSERSIVQINKDPLLITNNTQHKFDFLPVPVKDRKINYIFFRARNVSPNEYKLIVNFGKDQAKNGGFVVKVPTGADLNEYIIRISAQYKWFSDDNNWITFYPEGGDIEVYLLQISYSD